MTYHWRKKCRDCFNHLHIEIPMTGCWAFSAGLMLVTSLLSNADRSSVHIGATALNHNQRANSGSEELQSFRWESTIFASWNHALWNGGIWNAHVPRCCRHWIKTTGRQCTKNLLKAATKHCLRFGPGMQSENPKWSKPSRSWIQKPSSTRFLTPAMSVLPITPAAFVHVAPPASMRRSRTNIFPQKMASSQWCYSRLMVQSTYATSTFGKLSVWPPLRSPTFSACQRCDAAWFGCSSRCNSSTRLKAKSHQWVVLLFLTNWGKRLNHWNLNEFDRSWWKHIASIINIIQ